jgi:hypothetical protein
VQVAALTQADQQPIPLLPEGQRNAFAH